MDPGNPDEGIGAFSSSSSSSWSDQLWGREEGGPSPPFPYSSVTGRYDTGEWLPRALHGVPQLRTARGRVLASPPRLPPEMMLEMAEREAFSEASRTTGFDLIPRPVAATAGGGQVAFFAYLSRLSVLRKISPAERLGGEVVEEAEEEDAVAGGDRTGEEEPERPRAALWTLRLV